MYTDPIPKRFSKTPYKAIKQVYSSATGNYKRTLKAVMLTELEDFCKQQGITARILCYRALLFREYAELMLRDHDGEPTTTSTVVTWQLCAQTLEEVLRDLRDFVQ